MDDVRIVTVDALTDDDLLEQWVDAATEAERYEFGDRLAVYSSEEVRARQRTVTDHRLVRLAAVAGGVVVGQATLELPLLDNLHLASLELSVRPGHRRQGIGSFLLRELESLAASHGRLTFCVTSEVAAGRLDPAESFAATRGYAPAQVELRSDLDLPPDLDAVLAPLEADAALHADGYDLMTWWDDVPQQWLDERAHLANRMSTDAPMGQLALQEEAWNADRVRERLRVAREQGRRLVETVAVERSTGRLAAYTDLAVAKHTPDLAYQWDTLVLTEHRGRRLGQLVKAANLRALVGELPDVRRVVTWNAQVNAPMLRVNRAMGFVPVGVATEWQKILG